jgi:preprotein translocase subunit SecB
MAEGIVEFKSYELHELAYKKIEAFEGDNNLSLTITSQDNMENPEIKRVILDAELTGSVEAKIVISGIFLLTEDFNEQYRDTDLHIIATSLLLPYARSILSFVSASDGSKPLLIPTVNLNLLFDESNIREEDESTTTK